MKKYCQLCLSTLRTGTRRKLYDRLLKSPSYLHELSRECKISTSAIFEHLSVLQEMGLVIELKREGRKRLFTGVKP
jgi:predicted transcriptional regulator